MAKSAVNHQQMRERIAQLAARLIAEDGILDYAAAKRKAARQLGAEGSRSLPGNEEVELALRSYQSLFQAESQQQHLRRLRERAVEFMRLFERFEPRLTGPVIAGTATRHSPIQLHLFAENEKEVEMFLLDRRVSYVTGERRFRYGDTFRNVPAFLVRGDPEAEIAVFAVGEIRTPPRDPIDGGAMQRAKLADVMLLLGHASEDSSIR